MRSLALITILALSLAACGGGSGSAVETGTLKIMVTDAPFPGDLVETATVVIRRVEARNADLEGWQILFDGDAEDAPRDENGDLLDEDADGVPDSYAVINLIDLTGGITELLVEIEVPVGSYDEIRLIVDAGTVEFKEDAFVVSEDAFPESHTYTVDNGRLTFPSGAQSGIKVKIDEPVVVSSQLSADLTLDFDLSKNFLLHGSPDYAPGVKWVKFTPVARAVNNTTSGTLAFTVMSDNGTDPDTDPSDDFPIAFATVQVVPLVDDGAGGTVEGTPIEGMSTVDGVFAISLPPGDYNVLVEADGHGSKTYPGEQIVLANVNNLVTGIVTLPLTGAALAGQVLSDNGTPVGEPADETQAEDDTPLQDVVVTVWETGADPLVDTALFETTTDSSGNYRFSALDAGTYDVRFEIGTHEVTTVGVTVGVGFTTYQDVTLVLIP